MLNNSLSRVPSTQTYVAIQRPHEEYVNNVVYHKEEESTCSLTGDVFGRVINFSGKQKNVHKNKYMYYVKTKFAFK